SAPTKTTSEFVNKSPKETVPETGFVPSVDTHIALVTGVVSNVATFETPDTVVGKNFPNTPEKEKTPEVVMIGDNSGDNIVVNSQSDELCPGFLAPVCASGMGSSVCVHGVWTDVFTSGESSLRLCFYARIEGECELNACVEGE
ncbi:hypothetical protein L195_g050220, partial [Trifolium pratense]